MKKEYCPLCFAVPHGSPILFAQKENKKRKKAILFAVGVITGYLLPREIANYLKEQRCIEVEEFDTEIFQQRRCGTLHICGSYDVNDEKIFIEMLNRAIKEFKAKYKKIPKVFIRGEVIFDCDYALKADYCRLPYRVDIVSAPETFLHNLNNIQTDKISTYIHNENTYKLKR